MNSRQLCDTVERILALQPEESFILAGIFLAADEIVAIRTHLEPDELGIGAVGRYRNVPVFREEDFSSMTGARSLSVGELSGIRYAYVRVGVVN